MANYVKIECGRRDWQVKVMPMSENMAKYGATYESLYVAYDCPSDAKRSAFEDCCQLEYTIERFFHKHSDDGEYSLGGVKSHNCFTFCYGADFYSDGQFVARLHITKTYATLYVCDDYIGKFVSAYERI